MIRCVDLRIIINRHEECATNSKFDCSFLFTSAERLWLPPPKTSNWDALMASKNYCDM